jgi:seryl-tRNA synthetase
MHAHLLALEERIFQGLEIPYRVLDIAAGDLGAPAYRKFDVEAWMPGRGASGAFGEEAPGEWLTERQAILRYRRVFVQYRLFGDSGWLTSRNLQLPLLWRLVRYLPRADWFDTHATR